MVLVSIHVRRLADGRPAADVLLDASRLWAPVTARYWTFHCQNPNSGPSPRDHTKQLIDAYNRKSNVAAPVKPAGSTAPRPTPTTPKKTVVVPTILYGRRYWRPFYFSHIRNIRVFFVSNPSSTGGNTLFQKH